MLSPVLFLRFHGTMMAGGTPALPAFSRFLLIEHAKQSFTANGVPELGLGSQRRA
jgi:hypothetical protein